MMVGRNKSLKFSSKYEVVSIKVLNSMAKYLIFKLNFWKKRNNHENGMEMKVYTHVVKTTLQLYINKGYVFQLFGVRLSRV